MHRMFIVLVIKTILFDVVAKFSDDTTRLLAAGVVSLYVISV